jgi:hypothetical protein
MRLRFLSDLCVMLLPPNRVPQRPPLLYSERAKVILNSSGIFRREPKNSAAGACINHKLPLEELQKKCGAGVPGRALLLLLS